MLVIASQPRVTGDLSAGGEIAFTRAASTSYASASAAAPHASADARERSLTPSVR
jgi:hypothetical protein